MIKQHTSYRIFHPFCFIHFASLFFFDLYSVSSRHRTVHSIHLSEPLKRAPYESVYVFPVTGDRQNGR